MVFEEMLERNRSLVEKTNEAVRHLHADVKELRKLIDDKKWEDARISDKLWDLLGYARDDVHGGIELLRAYTGWSEDVAKRRAREGDVPCVTLARATYEFSARELRTWNLIGRPDAKTFYERYKAEAEQTTHQASNT